MDSQQPSPTAPERPDRLTIARAMLLTAGIAVGVTLFNPIVPTERLSNPTTWRELAFSVIAGLTIPAPLFCLQRRARGGRLGPGGLFVLSMGLGVWLLLPAAVIEYVRRLRAPEFDRFEAAGCLYYVMPMMGLWYLLASLTSGQLNRHVLAATTPWIERYGFLLAAMWTPLGAWHVVDVYLGVIR